MYFRPFSYDTQHYFRGEQSDVLLGDNSHSALLQRELGRTGVYDRSPQAATRGQKTLQHWSPPCSTSTQGGTGRKASLGYIDWKVACLRWLSKQRAGGWTSIAAPEAGH